MRQSDSSSASSTSTSWLRWIERPLAALWQFIVDFRLLLLFAVVLGLLLICVPQSRELWRFYILSFPSPLMHPLWDLIHALIVFAAFLFSGIVFARYAHRKVLERDARGEGRSNTSWMLPLASLLPTVLLLSGIAYAAWEYRDAGEVSARMRNALIVSGALIVLAVIAAAARPNASGTALARHFAGSGSFNRMIAVAALALLITFLGLPLLPEHQFVDGAQIMGALPAFLFALALLMYGIDAAFGASGIRRALALAGLVVVTLGVLFGNITDAHLVRTTDPAERKKELPDVGSEFLRWLEARQDKDQYDRYPVFIVAAQGGGLFSAYHTARVLANLQDQCPTFAQHVFAISGVSGGSLGAAVFASAVKSISPQQSSQPCQGAREGGKLLDYTDRFLKRDFLSPLAFLAIIPNIAQRVVALPDRVVELFPTATRFVLRERILGRYDRARGLEYGFEQAWRATEPRSGGRAKFFEAASGAAWTGTDATPALILNAARADTGITYSIAPFRLDTEQHMDFRAKVLAFEAPEVDVPISTAVGLSARYPFIMAPGMINVASRRWLKELDAPTETIGLVDGGFVENSGLATVVQVLREIHNAVVNQKGTPRRVAIHVIAVQDLSAFTYSHSGVETGVRKGVFLPESLQDLVERKDIDQPLNLGFVEFTAPLTALNASRSARSFYTLNSLVETVETLRCAQGLGNKGEPCAALPPSRSGELIEIQPVAQALFGLTANNRPLPLAWQLSRLSWQRIEKRAWANEDESWTCDKQRVTATGEKDVKPMNANDIAELRGLGEDLGGFVDRWTYACGRLHVRNVLSDTK